jgi:S1-C subfamily serine protease
LLTSLALVQAATRAPGPGITVKNGTFNAPAALWTWDEGRDLALLVVEGKGNSPSLPWAGDNPPLRVGDPIFAVGVDRVVPGVVAGVSPGAIQHNIFIDDPLRGGALVNIKGEVLAVASPAFTPGAQITDTVFFGVPIRVVCAAVLNCETGDIDRNAATTTTGRTRRTTPSTARARGATSTTG